LKVEKSQRSQLYNRGKEIGDSQPINVGSIKGGRELTLPFFVVVYALYDSIIQYNIIYINVIDIIILDSSGDLYEKEIIIYCFIDIRSIIYNS
jgi:hypothetical protein